MAMSDLLSNPTQRKASRLAERLQALGTAVVLIGLWEAVVWLFRVESYIAPAPSAIAQAAWKGIERGIYPANIAATVIAMLIGFVIGSAGGIALGIIVAEYKKLERIAYPYLVVFQSVPKVALAPLFVMWFGYGLVSKVVMVASICFFPLLVNTVTGLQSADKDRLDMVRTMTATRWQIFYHVKLPSAAGAIFAGLQVAIVLSLFGTLISEFVGSDHGLGNLITASQSTLDTAGMFVVLAILGAIGVIATSIVRFAQRRVVFWERRSRDTLAAE